MPTVELDTKSMRVKWDAIKEFSPRLARELRRELRGSGDDIIAEQKAILSGPLPKSVQRTGSTVRLMLNKKSGKYSMRKLNVYGDAETKQPGRSTGLREGIKAGLRTRVVISNSRTSVQVRTTGAKKTGAAFYQSKLFKHPVFGNQNKAAWALQRGMPYFWQPAYDGAAKVGARVSAAVETAFNQIPSD